MAPTKIADIIVPEIFQAYLIQRTTELSNLIQSGIVVPDPNLDELAVKGGNLINMPYFTDLDGDDEVLTDSGSLTPAAIGTGQDQAVLHMRGKAWGVNDLAKALSGDDPMAAIVDLTAAYWARKEQAVLVNTLNGIFADNVANDSSDLVHDIAAESIASKVVISTNAVIDATQKLGDAAGGLAAMMVHSAVYGQMQKNDQIDFIVDSEGNLTIPTYLGKRVIVDDGCPKVAGSTDGYKYTSFLFGLGAIGRGEGAAPVPLETDRDSLAGNDILINRRHFLLHPRGIKFTSSSVAGKSPTNAELAAAANWDRVYDQKAVRIVSMVTN